MILAEIIVPLPGKFLVLKALRTYQQHIGRLSIFLFLSLVLLVSTKFLIDQSNIRNSVLKTIQAGIAPEKLITFKFSHSESEALHWKKDHEFELDGEMYDVVSTDINDYQIIYTCFHDTKESKYKRRMYKLIGSLLLPDGDQQNQQQHHLSQQIYFYQPVKSLVVIASFNQDSDCNFLYQNLYMYLKVGPVAPPPKV